MAGADCRRDGYYKSVIEMVGLYHCKAPKMMKNILKAQRPNECWKKVFEFLDSDPLKKKEK